MNFFQEIIKIYWIELNSIANTGTTITTTTATTAKTITTATTHHA